MYDLRFREWHALRAFVKSCDLASLDRPRFAKQ